MGRLQKVGQGIVRITIQNGNMCELDGDRKTLVKLFQAFCIKHPNAWHIQMYQRGRNRWDGTIKYISETGRFRIGLFPMVYNMLKEWNIPVQIRDHRLPLEVSPKIPDYLGNLKLYDRQKVALKKLLFNKVGGIYFRICAGDLAVGFGKSLLFCAIHEAFQRKLRTVLLLNDADLFNQFKREIPPMLPGEDIKFIQGSKVNKWGMFNVAMVQSLSRNLKKYQHELSNIDIVLIDEADIIDNKTYKGVIEHLYNTQVRIGLSGTIYMSKLKKDVMHNMNIRSFIGDKVDEVKIADQMKSGRATPVIVKMVDCNIPELKKHLPKFPARDYLEEYQNVIANNQAAYAISFSRMLWNLKYKRLPMIIMTKFIEHCENLYTYYQEYNRKLGLGLRIAYAHHETKKRESILQEMREGKLDILIITTIIARGKNIPTLQYLQNTAGMDSNEKTVQVLGRLVRKHESKNKAYLDDLCFPGHYLSRHNKHRKVYYQRERLKVIQISFDSKGKKRVVKRSKYAKNKRVKRIKNQ